MNFQGNRQREGVFSAPCDTRNNKCVRHTVTVIPQRTNTTTHAAKTAVGSSHLKPVQLERFKETGKKWACPTHDSEKLRKQSSATRRPLSKSCEKSTLRKFQEVNVYESFIEEGVTERRKNYAACEKTKNVASNTTERTTEACAVNPSRATPPNHAIRRYALYRGMACQ